MNNDKVVGNWLLRLLDIDGQTEIFPLMPVELPAREVLYEPGMPTLYAYFPTTTVISVVSTMESGASAEVALVGREGMIGLSGVFGSVQGPTSAVVQIAGMALRTPIVALRAAAGAYPSVRKGLDRYTEARLIEMAQTAACHRLHTVEARLARWLLGVHDRIEGDRFTLAQEIIADMLGVHRPTVSIVMQRFQEQGIIEYRKRAILVDHRRLEAIACECHGVLQREFNRLLRTSANAEAPSTTASVSHRSERETATMLETMREIAGRLLVVSIREQEAREQAEAANRSKDQFLAMVSHELRAPLNGILGWCAILASQRNPTAEHGLEVIERSARTQLKLVEELLDAARLTLATPTLQLARVCLTTIVESAVDSVKPTADEKHVALNVSVVEHLSPILADADRLRQVLLNVLTNAVKFTDAEGSIDVRVTSASERAQVIVQDTGRGISPALVPYVFDQFQQGTASDTQRRGLGLGLTIARMLITLHGGTIGIRSPGEGQGTICTIELPMPADESAAPPGTGVVAH